MSHPEHATLWLSIIRLQSERALATLLGSGLDPTTSQLQFFPKPRTNFFETPNLIQNWRNLTCYDLTPTSSHRVLVEMRPVIDENWHSPSIANKAQKHK